MCDGRNVGLLRTLGVGGLGAIGEADNFVENFMLAMQRRRCNKIQMAVYKCHGAIAVAWAWCSDVQALPKLARVHADDIRGSG